MKKLSTAALFLMLTGTAFAQEGRVGINTTDPKTTFDVNGKIDGSGNLLATDITGMQAPRLTRAELTAKGNALYGTDQKGALVYITDISGGDATSQRINISAVGYYYFDGTVWQAVANGASAAAAEPWYNVATNAGATANTQNIYQMGNVGIGTATPAQKLDVAGSIQMVDGNQGAGKLMVSDAAGKATWTDAATAISGALSGAGADTTVDAWVENAGNTVVSSGNVGIGTVSPTDKLHVIGNVRWGADGDAPHILSVVDGANGNSWIDFKTNNSTTKANLFLDAINNTFTINSNNTITAIGMGTGNVGIGTATPAQKLDVAGSIQMVDGNQGAGKLMVSDAAGKATWTDAATAISGALSGAGADTTVDAWVENAGNTVVSSGNVGIGTVSPTDKLHVIGNVRWGADGDAPHILSVVDGANGNSWIDFKTNNSTTKANLFLDAINNTFTINSNNTITAIGMGTGNVGIGTAIPSAKLEVNGSVKFPAAGTPGAGKVLTSDASGNATWQNSGITAAVMGSSPSAMVSDLSVNKYLGASITLTPGKWLINTNIQVNNADDLSSGTAAWVRYTLSSSSSTQSTTGFSFLQSSVISARVFHHAVHPFQPNTGVWPVNVTAGSSITLYLWSDGCSSESSALNVSSNPENYLFAIPMN